MLIRNKLILRFTLLVVVIQLVLSSFIYWFSTVSRQRRFHDRLVGEASLAGRMLVRDHHLDRAYLRAFRPRQVPSLEGEQVSVFDPDGQLIYTNAERSSRRLYRLYLKQVAPERPVAFNDGPRETVGVSYTYEGRAYAVFAGGIDDYGSYQMMRLRRILLVSGVGALALIVLAAWYFADEALRPIARVVSQVKRITASKLTLRVDEGNGTDEIAQLAITFNRMLDGLERAFDSQKSFVSHASHELRTPLTTLLGTLETATAYDQSLPEARQSMDVAIAEIRKLIALTNDLLVLARADEAGFRPEPVRLDECLHEALDQCRSRYPAQPVRFSFGNLPADHDAPFTVRGSAQLLTTLLLNLLDNACKYSGHPVTVGLSYEGAHWLRLSVTDQGPGIPAHELPRLFEPLYRGENGRQQPGHGIGLAVVSKVARLHGGQVELRAAPGGGTEAVLTLPAL